MSKAALSASSASTNDSSVAYPFNQPADLLLNPQWDDTVARLKRFRDDPKVRPTRPIDNTKPHSRFHQCFLPADLTALPKAVDHLWRDKNYFYNTALHLYISQHTWPIVTAMREYYAEDWHDMLQLQDANGATPLLLAMQMGAPSPIINSLMTKENVTIPNLAGIRPLMLAARGMQETVTTHLLYLIGPKRIKEELTAIAHNPPGKTVTEWNRLNAEQLMDDFASVGVNGQKASNHDFNHLFIYTAGGSGKTLSFLRNLTPHVAMLLTTCYSIYNGPAEDITATKNNALYIAGPESKRNNNNEFTKEIRILANNLSATSLVELYISRQPKQRLLLQKAEEYVRETENIPASSPLSVNDNSPKHGSFYYPFTRAATRSFKKEADGTLIIPAEAAHDTIHHDTDPLLQLKNARTVSDITHIDPHQIDPLTFRSENGSNLVHHYLLENRAYLIPALLAHFSAHKEPLLQSQNNNGETALLTAMKRGEATETIFRLMSKDSVMIRDHHNVSCLTLSARGMSGQITRQILHLAGPENAMKLIDTNRHPWNAQQLREEFSKNHINGDTPIHPDGPSRITLYLSRQYEQEKLITILLEHQKLLEMHQKDAKLHKKHLEDMRDIHKPSKGRSV